MDLEQQLAEARAEIHRLKSVEKSASCPLCGKGGLKITEPYKTRHVTVEANLKGCVECPASWMSAKDISELDGKIIRKYEALLDFVDETFLLLDSEIFWRNNRENMQVALHGFHMEYLKEKKK